MLPDWFIGWTIDSHWSSWGSSLDPELLIFVQKFEIYLVTQSREYIFDEGASWGMSSERILSSLLEGDDVSQVNGVGFYTEKW